MIVAVFPSSQSTFPDVRAPSVIVIKTLECPGIPQAFKRGAPCPPATAWGELGHVVPVIFIDSFCGGPAGANVCHDFGDFRSGRLGEVVV